jgi:hypothetical protein
VHDAINASLARVEDLIKQMPEYQTDCKDVRPSFITNDLLAAFFAAAIT